MAKVFVTQIPHRRDKDTDAFVPTVNISPAAEHGEIVVMMPHGASFYATNDLVSQLRKHLADYNYEDGDSLIGIGDPSIIAAAAAILGKEHGQFKILKWDRKISRYVPTHINV